MTEQLIALHGIRRPAIRPGIGGRLRKAFRIWSARRCQRLDLSEMDDRRLRDIGISREQARYEAGKPFWL